MKEMQTAKKGQKLYFSFVLPVLELWGDRWDFCSFISTCIFPTEDWVEMFRVFSFTLSYSS